MSRSRKTGVLAVLLFFCLTLASGVEAKQKSTSNYGTPLSAVDKQHLLNDTFVIVKTVSAIPKSVQRHLLGKSVEAGMADAGQPFQITDVISGKSLPFQRLIFAGTSSGYCFVYSEHGGFGYWTNVHLYRLSDAKAELVWRGTPQPRLNILDLSQLRGAIAAGKFTNDQLPASKNSY